MFIRAWLFILLLLPAWAYSAPIKKNQIKRTHKSNPLALPRKKAKPLAFNWKLDAGVQNYFFEHRQSGFGGTFQGTELIPYALTLKFSRRFDWATAHLSYLMSEVNLNIAGRENKTSLSELNGGLTFRRLTLGWEVTEQPYIATDAQNYQDVRSHWLYLGARIPIPNTHWRVAGSVALLMLNEIEGLDIGDKQGHKEKFMLEYWNNFKIEALKNWILTCQGFYEQRAFHFVYESIDSEIYSRAYGVQFTLGYRF